MNPSPSSPILEGEGFSSESQASPCYGCVSPNRFIIKLARMKDRSRPITIVHGQARFDTDYLVSSFYSREPMKAPMFQQKKPLSEIKSIFSVRPSRCYMRESLLWMVPANGRIRRAGKRTLEIKSILIFR